MGRSPLQSAMIFCLSLWLELMLALPSLAFLHSHSPAGYQSEQSVPTENPTYLFDTLNHTFFTGFGLIRNTSFATQASTPPSSKLYTAFNAHYELKPLAHFFLYNKLVQDGVSAEGGLFYYTLLNYSKLDEAFRVLTPYVSGRYSLWFGPNFALFGVISFARNYVVEKANENGTSSLTLETDILDFGGGFHALIGPGWFWKTQISLNLSYTGLAMRF